MSDGVLMTGDELVCMASQTGAVQVSPADVREFGLEEANSGLVDEDEESADGSHVAQA